MLRATSTTFLCLKSPTHLPWDQMAGGKNADVVALGLGLGGVTDGSRPARNLYRQLSTVSFIIKPENVKKHYKFIYIINLLTGFHMNMLLDG